MNVHIHSTAIVENGVGIGEGTSVWDTVHIHGPGTRIGTHCVIGGKTTIGQGARIGDFVQIDAFVHICNAVTIERGAMIGAGTVFSRDVYPRVINPNSELRHNQDVADLPLPAYVREGASIGARAVIGCDLEIGRFSSIGMGTIVTRSVADFHMVAGHPAQIIGYVCRCGQPLQRFEVLPIGSAELTCSSCKRQYSAVNGIVREKVTAKEIQSVIAISG